MQTLNVILWMAVGAVLTVLSIVATAMVWYNVGRAREREHARNRTGSPLHRDDDDDDGGKYVGFQGVINVPPDDRLGQVRAARGVVAQAAREHSLSRDEQDQMFIAIMRALDQANQSGFPRGTLVVSGDIDDPKIEIQPHPADVRARAILDDVMSHVKTHDSNLT